MSSWTHLIRFQPVGDRTVCLGQLVDTSRDIGQDSLDGIPIFAFKIEGSLYDARITNEKLQVEKLLAPIDPHGSPCIRCIGLNYKRHAEEAKMKIPEVPALFIKPPTAIADPHPAQIKIPKCAQDGTSDFEAELAVVISRPARDITAWEAPEYILGYTAANDVSARSLQMESAMPTFSKGLDSSCPMGPVLVSPSVVTDCQKLSVTTTHNDRVMQDGSTSDMIFGVFELLAYLSQGTTLEPGSVVLTGTPEGIGYFRTPRVFLDDGDRVAVRISCIGSLINTVSYD